MYVRRVQAARFKNMILLTDFSVLIRDFGLVPFNQYCRSMTFWDGSGSGDPYLWLMDPDLDPDPAVFVIDLQDTIIKLTVKRNVFCSLPTFWRHLHHFSKIKSEKEVKLFSVFTFWRLLHHFSKITSEKEVTKQKESRVFLPSFFFDRRIRLRIRIQEAQKHTVWIRRIRIRNTAF